MTILGGSLLQLLVPLLVMLMFVFKHRDNFYRINWIMVVGAKYDGPRAVTTSWSE